MRIGILGGTFDPPHNGHLAVAQAALDQLELDEVMFVPAHRNPLKARGPVASAPDRLAMVQLAVENNAKYSVSDQELRRRGPSYTIDTLDELHMARPAEYWLIVGFDALIDFPNWKSSPRILKLARFACYYRGRSNFEANQGQLSAEVLAHLDPIEGPKIEISSTDVRLRIQERKPFSHLIPPKVEAYIREKGLYR